MALLLSINISIENGCGISGTSGIRDIECGSPLVFVRKDELLIGSSSGDLA